MTTPTITAPRIWDIGFARVERHAEYSENERLFLETNPADGSYWLRIGRGVGLKGDTDVAGPFETRERAVAVGDMLAAEYGVMRHYNDEGRDR